MEGERGREREKEKEKEREKEREERKSVVARRAWEGNIRVQMRT
jgi:hypothetical protein